MIDMGGMFWRVFVVNDAVSKWDVSCVNGVRRMFSAGQFCNSDMTKMERVKRYYHERYVRGCEAIPRCPLGVGRVVCGQHECYVLVYYIC
jgi:hypothetical protein